MFIIIGLGRSGTTLLQQIMNTFDGFCNREESRVGPERTSCYNYVKKSGDFSYLEDFIKSHWTKTYFVEKTPNSVNCLPELARQYPNANYIFLERHPLRILLSLMNMFPPGEKHRSFVEERVRLGLVPESALNENYEVFHAKHLLKAVRNQIRGKQLFANQVTIRYEDMIEDVGKILETLESKFHIRPNVKAATDALSRPSKSSTGSSYGIKSISEPKAVGMIVEACSLWKYDYNQIPSTKVYPQKKYSLANFFRR